MYCKKCGTEVKNGEYCPKCGTKLDELGTNTKKKKNSIQKVVLIVVGVFAIFVLIGLVLGNSSNGNTNGLSADQIKSQAIATNGDYLSANYTTLAGKPIKIQGSVSSLQDGMFLMYTGNTDGIWAGDAIYVNVIGTMPSNLIDKDIITVYGVVNGKKTYDTAIGGTNTVPEITIYSQDIELNGKTGV